MIFYALIIRQGPMLFSHDYTPTNLESCYTVQSFHGSQLRKIWVCFLNIWVFMELFLEQALLVRVQYENCECNLSEHSNHFVFSREKEVFKYELELFEARVYSK